MLPYLTPARYGRMGFGTEAQSAADLRSLIRRAQVSIDRYCSLPLTPVRMSFRGGQVVGEEHGYDLGNGPTRPPQKAFWPRNTPLISVEQLRIYVTNAQYIEFQTGELFLTKESIHVTSLTVTSVGLFGVATMPIMGLHTPIAKIDYTYGYSYDVVDEELSTEDSLTYWALNQFWTAADVTVKVNGTVVTTGFTIDRNEGTIVFGASQGSAIVTASYTHPLLPEVAEAVGLTVESAISRHDLITRGMGGLRSLRVDDIEMERDSGTRTGQQRSLTIPDEAKQLLDGLHIITIR